MTVSLSRARVSWIGWCLCLMALTTSPLASADQAAENTTATEAEQKSLFQQMNDAVRTLNYRGVMVYARNGEMRGLSVVHRYKDGREQERIQSMGAEPREVIRDDDVVTCILPKDRQVMLDRNDLRGVLANVRQFSENDIAPYYDMVLEKHSRLIDRECRVYHIKPRDQYRYGYRLWLDEETKLPLRMDLLGESGQVLEQTMFTQIEFPESIPDAALKPKLDPAEFQWVRFDEADSMPLQGESHWQLEQLPPGFKLVERGMRMPADAETPIEHMLFSDGLATVSVMLRPQRDKRVRFQGRSRMGAVNVYAQQLNGHHLTVMGEVPSATVEFFGRQVNALNAAEPGKGAAEAVPAASQ
ncbi:MAG: MucB/RseB C-terminal domain-containing protein [Salinisphaeraceae bacterium]|nr:MucB/RseB C-terminal domain-containing protein [Salinisphaeraceae bacterium]